MHGGTLQNRGWAGSVCPVRIASFPARKSMLPRRGMRQRPTRAQGARRVRGVFDRTPEATLASRVASTLRRRTIFYRARQMADGRRTSALSANPPGFRAQRRFPVGRPISTRIRTRPRAAVGSARAITPTYPCLGARRSFLGAQVLRPFSLNCGGLRRPRGRLSPPRPAGDGGRRFFAHGNYLLLVIGARTAC